MGQWHNVSKLTSENANRLTYKAKPLGLDSGFSISKSENALHGWN